jgi:hypothetical protein|uniref:Uncharacterized protein n=1 Tax=uncultured marine virus TaxID=186617 RepID=A0A0F7L5Y9_9VIRU|nr:hypothetical protein [uncultured marine virus]
MRIRYAENIWPGHPGTYRALGLALDVGDVADVPDAQARRMLADFPGRFVAVEAVEAPVPSGLPVSAAASKPKRRRRKAAPKKEST